jgi:hypothetical protein
MNTVYRRLAESKVQRAIADAKGVAEVEHSGLRGRAREIFVGELLTPFLYPTMAVCTGAIVDANGHQSQQTDVIVYDRRVIPAQLFQEREGLVSCEAALLARAEVH